VSLKVVVLAFREPLNVAPQVLRDRGILTRLKQPNQPLKIDAVDEDRTRVVLGPLLAAPCEDHFGRMKKPAPLRSGFSNQIRTPNLRQSRTGVLLVVLEAQPTVYRNRLGRTEVVDEHKILQVIGEAADWICEVVQHQGIAVFHDAVVVARNAVIGERIVVPLADFVREGGGIL